jgi:hypothetical protein
MRQIRRGLLSIVAVALIGAALAAPATAGPPERVWLQAVLDRVSTPVQIAVEEETSLVAADLFPTGAAVAGLGVQALSVGSQVLLSDDAFAVHQAEPHIALNPTNSAHLLAGAQEGRFFNGGAQGNGYYVSTNGGASWTAGIVPGVSAASGNPAYERATDPVVAFGPDGTAYFCSLAINITTVPGAIFVNRWEPTDTTWQAPDAVVTSETAEHFLDKQWMTVDNGAASPHRGRLYVTWSDFIAPPGNPANLKKIPIMLAWSDDKGASWSAPIKISGGDTYNQGSQPVVAPDGTVHVIYYGFGKKDMRIVTSKDGGATWTNPKSAARVVAGGIPGIRTAEELPTAVVDPLTGTIVVVWQDARRDVGDVMLVRSTTGGLTWSAPLIVNDGAVGDVQFTPAVAIRGGVVHVSWHDGRDSAADPTIYTMRYATSSDFGATFGPSSAISDPFDIDNAISTERGKFLGDYAGLVATGASAHPVWVDSRDGENDVWSNTITP